MKKPRIQQDDAPGGLTHNPFAALRPGGAAAGTPAAPEPVRASGSARDARRADAAGTGGRVVVQREKKGRGGKTVTRVAGLRMSAVELGELAREMKRGLGCGASIDADDVLLQGALTERAAAWLEKRLGVDVTIGN